MKKPSNYTYFLYLVILAGLFFIGREIIESAYGLPYDSTTIFCVACFAISFVVTALFTEIGHLIGAKICNYEVVSVHWFGFSIINVGGKIAFRSEPFNGFTGETKVKAKEGSKSPRFFFFSGFLLVLIINVALILVAFLVKDFNENYPVLYNGFLLFTTLSMLISLYSIIPCNVDSVSDGMLLRDIKKEDVELFNKLCDVESKVVRGEKLVDVEPTNVVKPALSRLNHYAFISAVYNGDYTKAKEINDLLFEKSESVAPSDYNAVIPNRLLVLAKTVSKDEFLQTYNSLPTSNRSFINKLETIEACRVYLVISGLILENEVGVNNCLRKYKALIEKIKTQGIKEQELELANSYLKEIQEAHTDWNVSW